MRYLVLILTIFFCSCNVKKHYQKKEIVVLVTKTSIERRGYIYNKILTSENTIFFTMMPYKVGDTIKIKKQ